MPYLSNQRKAELQTKTELSTFLAGLSQVDLTAGDLNFLFTKIMMEYLAKKSYSRINDVVGALECAKLELYRRFAVPYEDEKKHANGDVYK